MRARVPWPAQSPLERQALTMNVIGALHKCKEFDSRSVKVDDSLAIELKKNGNLVEPKTATMDVVTGITSMWDTKNLGPIRRRHYLRPIDIGKIKADVTNKVWQVHCMKSIFTAEQAKSMKELPTKTTLVMSKTEGTKAEVMAEIEELSKKFKRYL